jgi:hypothetical protein
MADIVGNFGVSVRGCRAQAIMIPIAIMPSATDTAAARRPVLATLSMPSPWYCIAHERARPGLSSIAPLHDCIAAHVWPVTSD